MMAEAVMSRSRRIEGPEYKWMRLTDIETFLPTAWDAGVFEIQPMICNEAERITRR